MPDAKSKTAWEAENMIKVTVKVNKNTDPQLYALLEKSESRSGLARELMRKAIKSD